MSKEDNIITEWLDEHGDPQIEKLINKKAALMNKIFTMNIEIKSPDWFLLRKQKEVLLNTVRDKYHSECSITLLEAEALEGILHFIDSIQDAAVDSGKFTEEEVFGVLS